MAFNYANEADIAVLLAEVRKYVPFYAGCSTAASTAAKEINDLTGFSLRTGATIRVKFANSNTAQNPTLNVNSTGAKSIYKYGSSSAGITAGSSWESGAVVTLTYDGTAWIMNDWIDAEFSVMTGATSSTAGTSGLVPAPDAGSQEKYLKGDGTWGNPGGSRPIAYQLDAVTGTGGAYTHTTTDLPVTATMKATGIEVSDTTAFGGQITVTVNDGSITLSCPEVNGTSNVTVSVMQAGDAASGGQTITSEEFDILSNRIGTMSALTTQTKTTVVGAVNEVNQNVNNKVDRSDYDATKIPLSGTDSTSIKQALTNIDADIEKTQSGLAVIVDGDTCSVPVPADSYAYIKSNTHGLENGLYKNVSGSAFPVSGGTADNTVFSAVPDGGLNDLKSKMGAVGATDLQSQITSLNSNVVTLKTNLESNEAANTSTYRNVWFSDSNSDLKRVHDSDFQYNPGTNDLKVGTINGKTVKEITYKNYEISFDGWTAGTPGVRAAQKAVSIASDINAYGTAIGVFIVAISDSSLAHYQAFLYGESIYVNAYRATSSSVGSGYPVTVRVVFAK